jgi:RNA polymerase sigma-70 factor (ECF subfamily)
MRADDEKSFEELAVPHLDLVFRVAARLTRNDHEAEDLVQETYLKAYKAFDRFEMREFGIRPWLLRILHNTFLNRVAREKRAPLPTDQQTLEQVHGEPASDSDFHGPPALNYELLDAEVKTAMERLAPPFRLVLSLWATTEFGYQEIADILDVPIGTVMSRLHRARQQLVRDLEDYAREHRLTAGGRNE